MIGPVYVWSNSLWTLNIELEYGRLLCWNIIMAARIEIYLMVYDRSCRWIYRGDGGRLWQDRNIQSIDIINSWCEELPSVGTLDIRMNIEYYVITISKILKWHLKISVLTKITINYYIYELFTLLGAGLAVYFSKKIINLPQLYLIPESCQYKTVALKNKLISKYDITLAFKYFPQHFIIDFSTFKNPESSTFSLSFSLFQKQDIQE